MKNGSQISFIHHPMFTKLNHFSTFWIAALAALAFGCILFKFYEPHWFTNDDIGMSMIIHGYGISSFGSPSTWFSNVLWGHLIQLIPSFFGIWGYTIATYCVLFSSNIIFLWSLLRANFGLLGSLILVEFIIMLNPLLFPQFTINAGMFAISAVLMIMAYDQSNKLIHLILGFICAAIAFLIRAPEFLLVSAAASTLLPWKILLRKPVQIACVLFVLFTIFAYMFDKINYSGDEWRDFKNLNIPRTYFTDFGAGSHVRAHPDILKKHNVSINDIDLVLSFFFVDANVANHEKLQSIINESGFVKKQLLNFRDGLRTIIKFVTNLSFLPLLVIGILGFMVSPSWRLLLLWVASIMGVFVVGLTGRGVDNIIHVVTPLAVLLSLAPFALAQIKRIILKRVVMVVLFAIGIFNFNLIAAKANQAENDTKMSLNTYRNFPSSSTVVWGGAFPYVDIYLPFTKINSKQYSYQLYSLGVFSVAPNTRSFYEDKALNGMIHKLRSKEGVPILLNDSLVKLMDNYCSEHFSGTLNILSREDYGFVSLHRLRCN